MDVQVDRDALLRGLQRVQNIVEPRQTMPILANVLLEAGQDALRVTATDLEVAARVSLPARVAGAGAITLAARKLGEIVRELPSAPLALRLQDNAWVALRCAGAAYKLVGLPPDDFPPVEIPDAAPWLRLDGGVLGDMLGQTAFAMSHDESRYALNGILVALTGTELRLVATDGHRLALAVAPLRAEASPVSGIVPRKAVQEIIRTVSPGEDVEVAIAGSQFMLRMPNFALLARLIEGTFPSYEAVVPRAHPRRLVLGRAGLAAAIRRVSVLAEERTRPVKLTLAPGTLRLSAYHPDFGEAEESLEVDHAGEELVIGFNSRYLLDALEARDSELVVVELKDALSPGVIKSVEDEGSLCVIMPMRL